MILQLNDIEIINLLPRIQVQFTGLDQNKEFKKKIEYFIYDSDEDQFIQSPDEVRVPQDNTLHCLLLSAIKRYIQDNPNWEDEWDKYFQDK